MSNTNQVELIGVRFSQTKDLLFNLFLMCTDLINVLQVFFEFCSLFSGYGIVNGSFNLISIMLMALINERRYAKLLAGMVQNIADDGT